jgi:starvation-inducible DNA-binding protein
MEINIGIDQTSREKIANGLCVLLADTYTLYLKTHNFHWNVTGPMFSTLHLLFEEHYNEMWQAVDIIAERIRTLGFPAPGSYTQLAKLTSIKSNDEDATQIKAEVMIQQLVEGHETVIRTARQLIPEVSACHDEGTADLLTGRMEVHEKTAWMLRSLLD